MAKPFLRWAGSKKKLLPKLLEYTNIDFDSYYEPFMGSATLFFALEVKKGTLSDTNEELVRTYNTLKACPSRIHSILLEIENSSENYYQLRGKDPKILNDEERAARFIFLNRYCFNGIYRTNKDGQFNVPYSNNKTGKLPNLNELNSVAQKLKTVSIVYSDFEEIIYKNVKAKDLVYFDPPYAVGNRRIFNQYDAKSFGLNDLNRLSKLLEVVDKRNAKFILSYAYCKEALDIFSKWDKKKSFVLRNIAGFARHRRKAAELIITNIKNVWE